MQISILLANVDPAAQAREELANASAPAWAGGDSTVLAFAAVIVLLVVVAWAVFIRKPERTVGLTPEEAAASISGGKGSRRKIKHRYPTRAETGGLPPIKTKS